jgi:hypothetical protein
MRLGIEKARWRVQGPRYDSTNLGLLIVLLAIGLLGLVGSS